jgi:queuine tRNA-ribosyltransferase
MSHSSHLSDFFNVENNDAACQARAGRISTTHGDILTPVFMPVGTQATVKGVHPMILQELKTQIILANTYHLYLRPGSELIALASGLHGFMGWNHPILTDSGGFQIFSLRDTLKLDEDGVSFKSILDGSMHRWTPETNMSIQHQLGADIIMQLDECAAYPATKQQVCDAVVRSANWARRCLHFHLNGDMNARVNPSQALFAIVQGGVFQDLRMQSINSLLDIESDAQRFNGFGIGGYSVGESHEQMFQSLGDVTLALPLDRPRYLMGVGNPTTLLRAIALGIDMFDCVLPTRTARMGTAFSSEGRLNLRNARFKEDFSALDSACGCSTCKQHSRAYLRHLIISKEMLGATLLSIHNLHYLINLMKEARDAIIAGKYTQFLDSWLSSAAANDY